MSCESSWQDLIFVESFQFIIRTLQARPIKLLVTNSNLDFFGPKALLQKRGKDGVRLHLKESDRSLEQIDGPGFPVEIHNIRGAGDALGSGFLYGYLNDRGWCKTCTPR